MMGVSSCRLVDPCDPDAIHIRADASHDMKVVGAAHPMDCRAAAPPSSLKGSTRTQLTLTSILSLFAALNWSSTTSAFQGLEAQ